ncbi:amidase [Bradyrhizobium japonicum]|uniref:amidase n=1 Tax=Bradyrhizobium japonicum TaxID=375 RepID=UPI001BADB5FB|nr:amidase [Bradyrhizobium japonicum]MBR0911559.1 amidase [Bradyrhizobium japonicum]
MKQDDLATLSASRIAELVRNKQLSPVEVVAAAIERTEKRNPTLNSVIFTDFGAAKERAHALEARIMHGDSVGILAGVPTYMKDLFDFKPGWPSTLGGIRALSNFKPNVYSHYPARMEKADAIVLGKTNSATMGFCGITDNLLFGPTRNPFDTSRNSGGSSGGAAAVADGIVPIAEGTDGGGSIRIPAAWSCVVGFQASFGVLPAVIRPNAFGATTPFVYEGPMAREVIDIALSMNALATFDARDPHSIETSVDFVEATGRPIKGKRIGFTSNFGMFPVESGIANVVTYAVKSFELAGAHVDEVRFRIPYCPMELSDLWCRMISAGSFAAFQSLRESGVDILKDHREDLPQELLHWIDVAARMSLPELQADQIMRSIVFDEFLRIFENYDYIVAPTTACLPIKNGSDGDTVGPSEIDGIKINRRIGWAMTYFTNFTGNPCASVPAGMVNGLPVGLQIMGRRRADDDVLAACACFEQIRPWKQYYRLLEHRALARGS